MQFSKAQKNLHETNNFNPPPGYYAGAQQQNNKISASIANTNFSKQERFTNKQQIAYNPGPGHYYNDKAERVRKRIIEQARRKQNQSKGQNQVQSEIKISSIPSIPKKSTTRVYQQLAPGILILHEQQNEKVNIGPCTYNANHDIKHKKTVSHRINPQHKKPPEPEQPQIKIPTIAEQIRNEKRLMYKKNVAKGSGMAKNIVSPSDLCLQVIILRQKLLRSQENPPPGLYYNDKYQSSFKQADPDLLPQYQLMMGKQQRFKQGDHDDQVGPGQYEIDMESKRMGGFIPKGQRIINDSKKTAFIPGPGTYKVDKPKQQPVNPKGNYPPIFGSGSSRFNDISMNISQTPGPGSYKADKPRGKKQKYIKIKRQFYESQMVKPQNVQEQKKQLISLNGDKSRSVQTSFFKQRHKQKNNHYFTSKVERFQSQDKYTEMIGAGPGGYEITNGLALKQSFNRNHEYTGSKQPRFDDVKIRPNLGPGAYFAHSDYKFSQT